MITDFSGPAFKILFEDELDLVLTRGSTTRPAARFNRVGQDALYLSASAAGARVAMRRYAAPGDRRRVIVEYEIGPCRVLDLRHPAAREYREAGSGDWLAEHVAGREPGSWRVADRARGLGVSGLVDPSRKHVGHWHLTLFSWNVPGAPSVRMTRRPVRIDPSGRAG